LKSGVGRAKQPRRACVLTGRGSQAGEAHEALGDTALLAPRVTHSLARFDYTARHPDALAMFGKMMIDFHGQEVAAVAAAYTLSDAKSVLDVGGGPGNLLAALLEANPSLTGAVFERPPVAEAAIQWLHAAGLSHRSDVLEGDFFESIPATYDVYVLSHVIHDWDEARCLTLLANCRRAMAPGGRLLIVETVLPGPNEPSPACSWT
jgi:SAM-dependent methyltransferase